VLPPHPGEDEIVAEALRDHRERLLQELKAASSWLQTLTSEYRRFPALRAQLDRQVRAT